MPRGRPPTAVTLTDDEPQRLNTLARRSRSAPQLARRARIILACADRQPTGQDPIYGPESEAPGPTLREIHAQRLYQFSSRP